MTAYKLFRVKRNGKIGSLFINRQADIQLNVWHEAECHPTKGFAVRQGWHCTMQPIAPHLSTKGRKWFQVEVEGITTFDRPECQGGTWVLARFMKVIGEVTNELQEKG